MSEFREETVASLVEAGVLTPPMDGNHGEIHPRGNDFLEEGIPFIVAADINDSRIDITSCKFIDPNQACSLRKGRAIEGDVLLTHKGTIGRTAIVPSIRYDYLMLTPQVTYYRIADPDILNNNYLKYYFDTARFQSIFENFARTGSTRAYLGITGQQYLPIRFPNIKTQRNIAKILSDIDKKIELNQRINAELESLAKTIYDYWFVQFDFPDENGRPYKSSGGAMEWSDVLQREIPAGWNTKSLSDIANITMGQSPPGDSYNEVGEGIEFFQGCTDFGLRSPDVRLFTSSPNRMAKVGDILLSVRAPVGSMNIADRDCCIGRGLAALNSKQGFDAYLYYVMAYFKRLFDRRNSEGTTFGSITKNDLADLKVVAPDTVTLRAYDKLASQYNQLASQKNEENRELIELRDWLLPMLMNGQVRVT